MDVSFIRTPPGISSELFSVLSTASFSLDAIIREYHLNQSTLRNTQMGRVGVLAHRNIAHHENLSLLRPFGDRGRSPSPLRADTFT